METRKAKESKQELKKVDFRKIEVENVDGTIEVIDVSKVLGNIVWKQAQDLETNTLGREIWGKGEVELTKENIRFIEGVIPQFFAYIYQKGMLNAIK